MEEVGIQSPEARVAWEVVEEISSALDSNNVEPLDDCPAFEELNRV
jgi:hypothetical protein